MNKTLTIAGLVVAGVAACLGAAGEKPAGAENRGGAASGQDSPDVRAIRATAESYIKAFNEGNAKVLAAHWADEGDYIDETGRHLTGRAAIEDSFESYFKSNKGLKLQISITSIRFPTDNLAVEDGTTVVIPPDKSPSLTVRYTAVHVKESGAWKIVSVREAVAMPPTNSEHLEPLDWLIGDWIDEGEHGDVLETSCDWSADGNFIVRSFMSSINGNFFGSGVQWIGWDAGKKCIRSWSHDSSGGFSESVWTTAGDKWVIESSSTLPDGSIVTQTGTVTHVDPDTLTWQATNRKVDGESVPDSKMIEVKRRN